MGIDTIIEQSSVTNTERNTASLWVRKISNRKKMNQSSIDFANLSKKSNGFDILKTKMTHSSTKNDLKNLTTPCLGKALHKPFVAGGAIQPKIMQKTTYGTNEMFSPSNKCGTSTTVKKQFSKAEQEKSLDRLTKKREISTVHNSANKEFDCKEVGSPS